MSKTILILVFSSFTLLLNAQKPHWLSSAYLNVETAHPQLRFFKSHVTFPTDQKRTEWSPTIANWKWLVGLGFDLNKQLSVESGYYQKTYYNGINHFDIPNCEDNFGSWTSQDSEVDHFYLRLFYKTANRKFLNRPIKFYAGLGYAYAISPGPSDFQINFGGQCAKDTSLHYYNFHNRSIDAIQTTYHLLEVNLKTEYQIFNHFRITFGLRYNQGFKTIGIFKMDYGIVGGFKGYDESETKGTNFEFCIGAKLYPFANLEQKPKKRKPKFKEQGRFRD